jgi:predicted RNase H-like HicB family nuclease
MVYLGFITKEPESSYWISFPDLPGCFSAGDTEEEVRKNAKDAVETHLETIKEQGYKIPLPRSDEEILKSEELPPPGYKIHHVYVETELDYS